MAADREVPNGEPAANGLDLDSAEQEVQKDGHHKISAAEKRRQRKKKNKQAKQVERYQLLLKQALTHRSSAC